MKDAPTQYMNITEAELRILINDCGKKLAARYYSLSAADVSVIYSRLIYFQMTLEEFEKSAQRLEEEAEGDHKILKGEEPPVRPSSDLDDENPLLK